jgi:DNA-binding transcriptional ArsR family regulator
MVNYFVPDPALDAAFGALADPARRAILARLAGGEASVKELAAPLPMSLPAVLKHVTSLERAGLLQARKEGRVRWCRLEIAPLRDAAHWLERYQEFWTRRLDALARFLTHEDPGKENDPWPRTPPRRPSRSKPAAATRRPRSASSRPSRTRRR